MQVLKNLFGLNKKIAASEIAIKNKAGEGILLDEFLNMADIYSTEEQVIGTWIDGKPIYKKTISIEINSSSNIIEVSHDISNLDSVIKYEAFFKEGGITRFVPQFYYDMSSTYALNIYLIGTDTVQVVYGTWAQNAKPTIYATLYYTKTTD